MGNAAGGVHMATLGGLWQAAIFGFAGITEQADGVMFAPRLPESWRSLRFSVCWRRRRLAVKLNTHTRSLELQMAGTEPMTAGIPGGPSVNLLPGQSYSLPLGV
jgi:trehalose/maltose hydrolase-like predicted phosphorylase